MSQYLGRSQSHRFLGVSWFPVDSSHLCSAPGVAQRVVPGCDHCCTAHPLPPPALKASACRALPSHNLRLSSFCARGVPVSLQRGHFTFYISITKYVTMQMAGKETEGMRRLSITQHTREAMAKSQVAEKWISHLQNLDQPSGSLPARRGQRRLPLQEGRGLLGKRSVEKRVSEDFLPISGERPFPLKSTRHLIFPHPQFTGAGALSHTHPSRLRPAHHKPPAPSMLGLELSPSPATHTPPCAPPRCAGHPRAGTGTPRAPPPCQG